LRTFRSDNNAGLCPEALEALRLASDGSHEIGYGDDRFTADAVRAFQELLGVECSVWFVATGTAANTLAIAALTEPWQQVVCHAHSHYHDDESTAPERITHCRTLALHTDSGKLSPDQVAEAMARQRGDVHQPQPGVLTVSNPTEFGTVYTPKEMAGLCRVAHGAGFRVHVDGARFANAVASLGCTAAELSALAGVDALSFGGTKNGLAFGEAVVFFPQEDGHAFARAVRTFPYHRKGTGHLLSKHRFVAAPFAATLRGGAWLRHAAHANAMARRLAAGLTHLGLAPRFPCQANGVFVSLPDGVDRALRAAGHGYYPFGEPAWRLVRLMCSFDTPAEEVDAFLGAVHAARETAVR
jgi:threonine aldolase